MSKPKSSKLDQFAETLADMEKQNRTLAQMVEWLRGEGVTVSTSRLSDFLSDLRQEKVEQQLFGLIGSGARMNRELDKAYQENPAPDIDQLIRVTKSLVMSLQVKGAADPTMLGLANNMQRTVLDYTSGKAKFALEERKLDQQDRKIVLLEKKAAAFDTAKGILENKELTEDQRKARMREVFGIS